MVTERSLKEGKIMGYYLGIDGGGTKTTAAVADDNGLLFKKEGKSINFYSVGMECARKNLRAVVSEIEAELNCDGFEAVVIGCSALDDEADSELINELCGGAVNAKKIKMTSDVHIALESVGGAACPCVAVCGTGSMAVGRDGDGNILVTGGWGHVVGDEGSAYVIAAEGLRLCCEQSDKGEATALLKSALEFFGVSDFRSAIDVIYSPETTKDVLASFASCIGGLAQKGDEAAKGILTRQAEKFAQTVITLLDKIKTCDTLGLYGGVLKNNPDFAEAFCRKIKEDYTDLKIVSLDTPPEESAIKLARKMI